MAIAQPAAVSRATTAASTAASTTASAGARTTATVSAAEAVLENASVRVRVDLLRGTYEITDKAHTATPAVADAYARVGDWTTSDPGAKRTAEAAEVADEIGRGQQLTITSRAAGAPAVLLQLTVYDGRGFVALAAGLDNAGRPATRLSDYHPLTGGTLLAGGAAWSDVRSLNDPSSTHQSRVSANPMLSSANAMLLTFKQDGQRRSAVLGALKTSDFTKWVSTLPEGGFDARGAQIASALPGSTLVTYLDGGRRDTSVPSTGPKLRVVAAEPFSWPVEKGDARFGTVLYEPHEIGIEADGLDSKKRYALGWSWWDYDNNGRIESVGVIGSDGQRRAIVQKHSLPAFAGKGQRAEALAGVIPPESYRDGRLHVWVSKDSPTANAVVGEMWLYELGEKTDVPAALRDGQPVPGEAEVDGGNDAPRVKLSADLEAFDPVGRLIDAGERYMPADNFYFDVTTADPFVALEQYGRNLALATGAKPSIYNFPTVCAWYAGVWKTPGAQDHPEKSSQQLNTSAGLVREMDEIAKTGFLKYSRAAVRLVPDTYQAINPQGWWDDQHWQSQGYYVAPYNTSKAFGDAVHQRGGLAFIYFQPACIFAGNDKSGGAAFLSKDFRETHQGLLINNDVRRTLDYTKPATVARMKQVFANLRNNISGVMFDYCDDFWVSEASRGGFSDPKVTSTAFYRTLFKLAKTGLGEQSFVHERNLGRPNNDLTLGLVDLQRLSWDTDKITPDMVSRGGLRWFKNRVVINYDMDAKELKSAWKVDGWTGSDEDGRRMTLTMAYVTASRLLLANSFRDLTKDELHDLTRVMPYHAARQSARPIDALVRDGWPRVYDFAVDDSWHQLTLYNNTLPTKDEVITVPFGKAPADGGLGLEASKRYYVYDFWMDKIVDVIDGAGELHQPMRPGEAKMLSIHAVEAHPQFISTNRHLMQGFVDLTKRPTWDENQKTLSGEAAVVGDDAYQLVIATNGRKPIAAKAFGDGTGAPLVEASIEITDTRLGLAVLTLRTPHNVSAAWEVRFE